MKIPQAPAKLPAKNDDDRDVILAGSIFVAQWVHIYVPGAALPGY